MCHCKEGKLQPVGITGSFGKGADDNTPLHPLEWQSLLCLLFQSSCSMSHWLVSRNKSRIQFHDQETHFAKRFKERIFTWFYFMSKFRPEYCHSPSMRNCSITGSHRPPSLSPPPPLVKNFFRSSRQFFGTHLYSWAEKYTVKQREYHEQERRTMTSRS